MRASASRAVQKRHSVYPKRTQDFKSGRDLLEWGLWVGFFATRDLCRWGHGRSNGACRCLSRRPEGQTLPRMKDIEVLEFKKVD